MKTNKVITSLNVIDWLDMNSQELQSLINQLEIMKEGVAEWELYQNAALDFTLNTLSKQTWIPAI